MKKSEEISHNSLVEIPLFDFEHSQPNKFVDQYDPEADTVILRTEHENTVILEPDVVAYFPDSESVNTALRALISVVSHMKNPPISL